MNCLPIECNSLDFRINQLIENIFKFTVNKDENYKSDKPQTLVYLEEIAAAAEKPLLDMDLLQHALFERLLLESPTSFLIKRGAAKNIDERVTSVECITYLFECYKDLSQYRNNIASESGEWIDIVDNMTKLVVRNVATALKQPDLYATQNVHEQVSSLDPQ